MAEAAETFVLLKLWIDKNVTLFDEKEIQMTMPNNIKPNIKTFLDIWWCEIYQASTVTL